MAPPRPLILTIFLLLLLLPHHSFSTTTTTTTTGEPSSRHLLQQEEKTQQPQQQRPFSQPQPSFLEPILLNLGFHDLSSAAHALRPQPTITTPSTLFAPTDGSLRRCTSCTPPLLLQEHTIPGLFSLDYLLTLPFGTKIETSIPGRCLTLTTDPSSSKVFVGGLQITQPDIFNNGLLLVHGIEGLLSHLSPFSCNIERTPSSSSSSSSATFRSSSPPSSPMAHMLRDAVFRLRVSGYSVLSLALRVKFPELASLENMTVFGLDDVSIFNGGHVFVNEVRFHIVPGRLLSAADLEGMPPASVITTMEPGQVLVVSKGEEGISRVRINYVGINNAEVVRNQRIVVHGVFTPLPRLGNSGVVERRREVRGDMRVGGGGGGGCGAGAGGSQGIRWSSGSDDHHGL